MEGWIKLHRSLLEWEWFQDTVTLHVFVYILLRATPSDTIYKGINVPRGSLITSIRKIGEDTHIPDKRVRNAIKRLTDSKQIIIKATNKFSLVSICNYEFYQMTENDAGQTKGKQRANKGRAGGQSKGEPSDKEYKEYIDISNDISLLGEKKVVAPQPPAKPVRAVKTIEEREREFMMELSVYEGVYPAAMIDDFARYWCEPNKTKMKMKFELQQTWDTARRLSTWARRDLKYSGADKEVFRKKDSTKVLDSLIGNI